MSDKTEPDTAKTHPPAGYSRANGAGLFVAALDFIRGSISPNRGSCGWPNLARQEKILLQWASNLGLPLNPSDLPSKTIVGGQEHELFHETASDRYIKVTRNGIFGLSPGIEFP